MKKQLFQHVVERYGYETRMEEVGSASGVGGSTELKI